MKRLRDYIIDGFLLVLPIAVVVLLLRQVVGPIAKLMAPVSERLPEISWLGLATVDLIVLLALLLGLAVIGVFARSPAGRAVSRSLERVVLRKIPGFLMLKSVAAGFSSEEREMDMKPALIEFDDHISLGFVIEDARLADDLVTVFLPSAPTPVSGEIALVKRARVHMLNVPVANVLSVVGRLGLGLQELKQGSRS
jgi:uncharacterized membrane protein